MLAPPHLYPPLSAVPRAGAVASRHPRLAAPASPGMSEGAEAETGGISLMSLTYEQLSQLKKSLEDVRSHLCRLPHPRRHGGLASRPPRLPRRHTTTASPRHPVHPRLSLRPPRRRGRSLPLTSAGAGSR